MVQPTHMLSVFRALATVIGLLWLSWLLLGTSSVRILGQKVIRPIAVNKSISNDSLTSAEDLRELYIHNASREESVALLSRNDSVVPHNASNEAKHDIIASYVDAPALPSPPPDDDDFTADTPYVPQRVFFVSASQTRTISSSATSTETTTSSGTRTQTTTSSVTSSLSPISASQSLSRSLSRSATPTSTVTASETPSASVAGIVAWKAPVVSWWDYWFGSHAHEDTGTLEISRTLPWKLALSATSAPAARRTLFLVVRACSDHKQIFDNCFGVALDAFLDWRDKHLTVVLDAESVSDHAWGEELLQRFAGRPFNVTFSALPAPPADSLHLLTGFRFFGRRFASVGYHRQLFDTFFFDAFLPSFARDDDIIAICDVDAPLITVLPSAPTLLMRGLDGMLALHQQALRKDFFQLDGPLIAGNFSHDVPTVGMMDAKYLPQFFFKRTFAAFRSHVTAMWRTASFSEALFAAASEAHARFNATGLSDAGPTMFSPVNALLSYAVLSEPQSYTVAIAGGGGPAALIYGVNQMCYHEAMSTVLRHGCCRSFGFTNCSLSEMKDTLHVMSSTRKSRPFRDIEMQRATNTHYKGVALQLASLESVDLSHMRETCTRFGGEPLLLGYRPELVG